MHLNDTINKRPHLTFPRSPHHPQTRIPVQMKTPLLPELHSSATGGASVPGAVFNIATSIIGAGIMSIPATMRVLGVIPALLVIAAVAFLSDSSVEFLTRYIGISTGSDSSISYAGVMRESFGRLGSILLQLCVALTNAGALIMYLIIIGKELVVVWCFGGF